MDIFSDFFVLGRFRPPPGTLFQKGFYIRCDVVPLCIPFYRYPYLADQSYRFYKWPFLWKILPQFFQMLFTPSEAPAYSRLPCKETSHKTYQHFPMVMFCFPSASGIRHRFHVFQKRFCLEPVFSTRKDPPPFFPAAVPVPDLSLILPFPFPCKADKCISAPAARLHVLYTYACSGMRPGH